MSIEERLRKHFRTTPIQLSFSDCEGYNMRIECFDACLKQGVTEVLGEVVLLHEHKAEPDAPQAQGYCVVDVSLDCTGRANPVVLPLPENMKNHKIQIIVYVDPLNGIRMKAIGGYTK